MKINYLRTFKEENIISIDEYVNDMVEFQKNYSTTLEVSEYIPKINNLLKFIPNESTKMRIARYIAYPLQVKKLPNYDVTHVADQAYSHLAKYIKSKVKIITVNDLIPLVYEKKLQKSLYNPSGKGRERTKRYLFRYSVKQFKFFDRVIAISNNTKNDILNFTDCEESKISVIHTNIPPPYFNTTPIDKEKICNKYKLPIKAKKILISGNAFYKNNITSMKVLENLINKNIDVIIVWIGHNREDFSKIAKVNYLEKIIPMPMVDKSDLPSIYKICDVVLFPSLYEGMDTISLEGMRCGIPVVCSNTSSFPEIAGNAALMCNPTDDIEITKNILKLFENKEFYKKKVDEGFTRAKLFDYEKMHQKIINLYEEELAKKA